MPGTLGGGPGAIAAASVPQAVNPQRVVPQSTLASLQGLALAQQLSSLPEATIADFVLNNPDAVAALIASRPDTRTVAQWWTELGIDSRSAMLTAAPQVVGNLEGVPFGIRDVANRRVLTQTSHELSALDGGRSQVVDSENRLHMLAQVRAALVTPAGAPERHLISLDPNGTGTASIVIGDLAAADFVSILVPGMFYSVDGQMVAWADAAQELYDEEVAWVSTLAVTDPRYADAHVATVAWIGYETPSMVNFTTLDLAYQGRDAIAATINGLRELRGTQQPYLAVLAHSYGSTATMLALTDFGLDIDALVLVGSPGSSAQSVGDLGVAGDNVYVGEANWDQVKDSAFFGPDPGSAAFGAHSFSVNGGLDPLTGMTLLESTGHNEYFAAGTESMRNIALISLGQGRLATTDSGAAPVKRAVSSLR